MTRSRILQRTCLRNTANNLHRRHLHVESLESRWLLATFMVSNLNDAPVSMPGEAPGTLRQAIFDANAVLSDDEIFFERGLIGTIGLTAGALDITDSVLIDGPGREKLTVDAQGGPYVFIVDNQGSIYYTDVEINGLTITGSTSVAIGNEEDLTVNDLAVVANTGTGLASAYGTLIVNDSLISGNSTNSDGGGIFTAGGGLHVNRSHITNNFAASSGGGIFNVAGEVFVTGSTISGNSAADGGGIHNELSLGLLIESSTISGNSASGAGGGIYSGPYSTASVVNSTISGNTASGDGGGIINSGPFSTASIVNSTISGNTVSGDGGGIINIRGFMGIRNSTITDNRSTVGGGVASYGDLFTTTEVQSTIISDNLSYSGDVDLVSGSANTFASYGHNLVGGGNAVTAFGAPGDQRYIYDPGVAPLAHNGGTTLTHALLSSSPAIDHGANPFGLGLDQRGGFFVRDYGGAVDVGAFERQTAPLFPLVVDTITDEIDQDFGEGDLSLREAIGLANGSVGADVIGFDVAGTFALPQTIGLRLGRLDITDSLIIEGHGAAELTIDTEGRSQVFRVYDGDLDTPIDVTLAGLTITGGLIPGIGGGAGVQNSSENLTLLRSTITGNSSYFGGAGINTNYGNLTVIASNISGNRSTDRGGGIFSFRTKVTVVDSAITGNVGGQENGGGIWHTGADMTVSGSTISGNSAYGSGGGIFHVVGNLTVTDSTISGNAARYGGGISASTLSPPGPDIAAIVNSTVSGNTATNEGGGIYSSQGLTVIQNSTITNNSAPYGYGGGVASRGSPLTTRTELLSSIVSGNFGSDVDIVYNTAANSFHSNGFNLIGIGNASTYFGAEGDQTGITDPGLAPLAQNGGPTRTHALLPGSPAVNHGVNPTVLTTDQRGLPFLRDDGAGVDVGSFERQTAILPELVVNTVLDENDGDYDEGDLSLREAIGLSNGSVGQDEIGFDVEGVFSSPQVIALALGELQITDSATVVGPGADQLAIDAQGLSRVMTIYDGADTALSDVQIRGLTITGGRTTENYETGAGIRNFENLTLGGTTVSNNSTSGAFSHGGGVYNARELRIVRSTISGNVTSATTAGGGGIFTDTELYSTQTTIINSTVSGNASAHAGGGVFNFDGPTVIRLSTITNNDAPPGYGSGVASFGDNNTITEVFSSIIAGNASTDVDAVFGGVNSFQTAGYNLIGIGNALSNFFGSGDQRGITAPGLGPLTDNGGRTKTHALQPGSPAVDAGDPGFASPPHFDQRWEPFSRVFGGLIDIGAYERIEGDFDGGGYTCADVDALVAEIVAGTNNPIFDLNSDALVNHDDLTTWLAVAGVANLPSHNPYLFGDANLDGVVDGQDFIQWNAHKFTTVAAWCAGDFNADGVVDGQDFIIWNANKFTSALAAPSLMSSSLSGRNTRIARELIEPSTEDCSSLEIRRAVAPSTSLPIADRVDSVFADVGARRSWCDTQRGDDERKDRTLTGWMRESQAFTWPL